MFGDIMCGRMREGVVSGLVTDGAPRDVKGVRETSLPVWSRAAAAPSMSALTFVGWQKPVGCDDVAVFPDDPVSLDEDGAVLVPAAIIDEVIDEAAAQEHLEEGTMREVR